MIDKKEFKKYSTTTGFERIVSFISLENNTEDKVINSYNDNIKISQALYPELSIWEISLRNAIDTVFKMQFGEKWIENEVKTNTLLDDFDYNTLLKAYNSVLSECNSKNKHFSIGKVIANLNFGFWTNLCLKKYNAKIWTKKGVFK